MLLWTFQQFWRCYFYCIFVEMRLRGLCIKMMAIPIVNVTSKDQPARRSLVIKPSRTIMIYDINAYYVSVICSWHIPFPSQLQQKDYMYPHHHYHHRYTTWLFLLRTWPEVNYFVTRICGSRFSYSHEKKWVGLARPFTSYLYIVYVYIFRFAKPSSAPSLHLCA